jgi:Protein of unknown function (DUF1822)
MFSTFIEPTDWALKLSPDLTATVWSQSQSHFTNWSKWNSYLNRLCLTACLNWLKSEHCPEALAGWKQEDAAAISEFVNGFTINIGGVKLALIPTEAIDQTSIEVPQEWVDIPSWAADYYLALQVDAENNEIRIYGYTTHQNLKATGVYDASDRTYCLDAEYLNNDLNSLWLAYPRYTTTQTRTELAPLAVLTNTQADALIARLGDPSQVFARLEVPFQQWAALIENSAWRQKLYQQRQPSPAPSLVTRLSRWFEGQSDAMWQTIDQVLLPQPSMVAVRGAGSLTPQITDRDIYRVKVLTFSSGKIALVLKISPLEQTESRITLQIHPEGENAQLPGTTQLRLLTMDNQEVGQASAATTETIQLQFRVNSGEQFQIEITCDGQISTETFEL